MYDPKSLKAEEFINDEEILDCLKYAKENKVGLWSGENPKTSFFEKISNFIKKIFA